MSWIAGRVNDLPPSALLEEKIGKLEMEQRELESALQKSKADLAQANEANTKPTDRVNRAQEGEYLEEVEEQILRVLYGLPSQRHVNGEFVANHLQIHLSRAEVHLTKLKKDQFISAAYSYMNPTSYRLADHGNEYLVKNRLL